MAISFPESSFPLTSGRKKKALVAAISGMRHRCRLRSEPDGQNSVIFFVISKWLFPEPSFCDRWSRGTKTLGTRLAWWTLVPNVSLTILDPRGRAPFGQHRESRPMGRSNTVGIGLPDTLGMLRIGSDKFDWLIIRNDYSTHAQKIGPSQKSRFLVLTKRSATSWDENSR